MFRIRRGLQSLSPWHNPLQAIHSSVRFGTLSSYIRKFGSYLRKNETARGLFLVGLVILGAIAVWGGIRLALNTEYPILVVSSGSMCQRLTNPQTRECTLAIGDLIVIRGVDPATIK